jgi:antitoxin (DNA-binding transcriptional repressor) of toxin-antitoxin stability system
VGAPDSEKLITANPRLTAGRLEEGQRHCAGRDGLVITEELSAMETVSIRNLRGKNLSDKALKGRPLAITNRGALIGVIIPVAAAWVEHMIDYNWSHVRQSIVEGEQTMADATPMITIQHVIPKKDQASFPTGEALKTPEKLALTLAAAMVGGTVTQTPETKEVLERLQAALNPPASDDRQDESAGPSAMTVRIGQLSARLIEEAAAAGQTLALTNERKLIGIVIPVTPGLVEFLLEQNMSRVLYNIGLGEKQVRTPDMMVTLDETLRPADIARSVRG